MTAFVARIRGNLRKLFLLAAALALLVVGLPVVTAYAADPSCSALSADVVERVHATEHSAALSLRSSDLARFTERGFRAQRETSMRMAAKAGPGLVAVHRLYRSRLGPDYVYASSPTEVSRAVHLRGYVDEGVVFYAARRPADCLVPVWSYEKGGVHRYITTSADAARLAKAGWTKEQVRFYAGRPKADTAFSFAVYPDTQEEVYPSHDGRFRQRSQWLADNKARLDLRFATHAGDVVNWDTADHAQYKIARDALVPLERAGIPYSLTVGNHDTAAVGPGGSAANPSRTRSLLRDTSTFDAYFDRPSGNREGRFERAKVDNSYHVYTAGGVGWLVLNLELWPRREAVAWAQRVVAGHPRHNVIIVTHAYLTKSGAISTSAEYGTTAPSALARDLVLKYPNVRMVFSGHVGTAAHRVDRGVHGNRVVSLLNTFHSRTTNPVRLVSVDTRTNRLRTSIYAPKTDTRYPEHDVELGSMSWVR